MKRTSSQMQDPSCFNNKIKWILPHFTFRMSSRQVSSYLKAQIKKVSHKILQSQVTRVLPYIQFQNQWQVHVFAFWPFFASHAHCNIPDNLQLIVSFLACACLILPGDSLIVWFFCFQGASAVFHAILLRTFSFYTCSRVWQSDTCHEKW